MLWRRLAYNTSLVERLDGEVEPLVSYSLYGYYVCMCVVGLLTEPPWVCL